MELEDFMEMSDKDFIAMTSSIKETGYDAFWSIVLGAVAGAGISPFANPIAEKMGYVANNKERLMLITLLISGTITSGIMYGVFKKVGKGTIKCRKEYFNRLKNALEKLNDDDFKEVKKLLTINQEGCSNKNIDDVLYYTRSLGQEKLITEVINDKINRINYKDNESETLAKGYKKL